MFQPLVKYGSLNANCAPGKFTINAKALWVKFSADDILKYFPQKTGFDISCKLSTLETICMKCQILFWEENKEKVISLSSAELKRELAKG